MKITVCEGKLVYSLVYEIEYCQWRNNSVSASVEDISNWLGVDVYKNDDDLVIPNVGSVPLNDVIIKNDTTVFIVPVKDFLNGVTTIDNNLDCQKVIATFRSKKYDSLVTLNI